MTLFCVTNTLHNIKACTNKGAHTSTCDGTTRHGDNCHGCAPREAKQGALCWPCWERVQKSVAAWPVFAATIVDLPQLVTPDTNGIRTATSGYSPLTKPWLDVNEAESYLDSLTEVKGNVEMWVSGLKGASDAINFAHLFERAVEAHPLQEKPHRIQSVRCPKCGERLLVWNPPEYFQDNVTVTCRHEGCGHEVDQKSFEMLAEIEERSGA
jgi:hypothetical protein